MHGKIFSKVAVLVLFILSILRTISYSELISARAVSAGEINLPETKTMNVPVSADTGAMANDFETQVSDASNNPIPFTDPTRYWECTGAECEAYIQWIMDTMRLMGPTSQELITEFRQYIEERLNRKFRFNFGAAMQGNTRCGASSEGISCRFSPVDMPQEQAIPFLAHEIRHVLDGINPSIQSETRAMQTQFQVANEYIAWAELENEEKSKYLRGTQNSWLYPGGFKNGPNTDFMTLNPDSQRDLETAREMMLSWVPEASYGDDTYYPLFPRSYIEWQFMLIPREIGKFLQNLSGDLINRNTLQRIVYR